MPQFNDPIYLLYDAIADRLSDVDAKHPQAKLYMSEIVLLGVLFVLRGRSFRNFYRWVSKQSLLNLPERTRLHRLIIAKQPYTDLFLASETFFNVTDSFGVEVIHPVREKRSEESQMVSKKGKSNHRWIVGRKINVVLNSSCEVPIKMILTMCVIMYLI